jgi:2-polyprenyl-6-methoxyphenol hydroxylase-like FAD-dependent oxidoreductase
MKALIAGGGIAGPVTAMALQQVGIDATVYEAYPPADPDVGSYLAITANGLEGLAAISAFDLAKSAGFPTRRNVLWNHRGRRLAEISLDSTREGSPTAHTMKRSRLASLLQEEAVRRGIRVEYGRRLADAALDPDGRVNATFQDGGDATGDLLIGADGIQSAVRQIIDPNAPTGRYVGLTNFGGFTAGAAGDIEPEAWHMIFGRSAFFGYTATPQGDVVWFANLPRPMITAEEKAATSLDDWKRQLIKVFASDTGPAVELIESGELELAADNTHDLGHVPTWHRGPMVIIGDAAHAPAPSSGQGASMAIEDAIVLARSLHDLPTIHEALKAYDEERRQRVEKIVAWGARGSSHKTPGPVGRLTRDLMLPLLFKYAITEKSMGWMYDYRVRLDHSVTI